MEDDNGIKLMKAKPENKTMGDAGPDIQKAEGPKGWGPDKSIAWSGKTQSWDPEQ